MLSAVKAIASCSLFVDNKSEDNFKHRFSSKENLTIVYLRERERERLEREELNTVHRPCLLKGHRLLILSTKERLSGQACLRRLT